ncbi:MAG: hypothetical protein AAGJ32_11005 [Pseudomonadota bacterium]
MGGPRKPGDLKGLEALGEIGRRLGGLADQVRDALEEAEKAGDSGFERQTEFTSEDGKVSGVAGFRVRSGIAPRGGESGGLASAPGPAQRAEAAAAPERTLDVEVHDLGQTLLVSADMPGVGEADLSVAIDGSVLALKATGARRYDTEIALPVAVEVEPQRVGLKNGILEIVLFKREEPADD